MGSIEITRSTGSVKGLVGQRAAIRAMRMMRPLFAPLQYKGYSRACKTVSEILADSSEALLVLSDDTVFSFPMNDIYWIGLISADYRYEPELERVLRAIRDRKFTFIDAGANFGYWSVLVSGANYGQHQVLAIEPMSTTFSRLERNCILNNSRFIIERAAVADVTGETVHLGGEGHASISIFGPKSGEAVSTLTIDDAVEKHEIRGPIVLKLDVEGAEIQSIQGAEQTLDQDTLILYEDHGSDPENTSSLYLLESGWTLYNLEGSVPVQVRTMSDIDKIKINPKRGYNFAAAHDPWW